MTNAPVSRRFLLSGLAGGMVLLGPIRAVAQADPAAVRFQFTIAGRRFGARVAAYAGGATMVSVRELDGQFRQAFVLPAGTGSSSDMSIEMSSGGQRYSLQDMGDWVSLSGPDAAIGRPEGDGVTTQGFLRRLRDRISGVLTGIATAIAVGITLILGGDTVIPTGDGGYVSASNIGGDITVTVTRGGSPIVARPPAGGETWY